MTARAPALWALLACALLGFGVLAAGYEHDPLASIDADVSAWVAAEVPTSVEWVARPFSWLGGWIGLLGLGAVAGVLLVRERAWLELAFFLAAFAGSQVAVTVLKTWFDRPRPDTGSAVPLPESAAFPSGHATGGAAALGALAVLAADRLPDRRSRVRLWVAVVVAGLAVGLSRIALNVHFVTDVVAGWALGLAWLAACLLAREGLRRETRSAALG